MKNEHLFNGAYITRYGDGWRTRINLERSRFVIKMYIAKGTISVDQRQPILKYSLFSTKCITQFLGIFLFF